jgi:hypothetical protein
MTSKTGRAVPIGMSHPAPPKLQRAPDHPENGRRVPLPFWSAVACYRLGLAKLASPRATTVCTPTVIYS